MGHTFNSSWSSGTPRRRFFQTINLDGEFFEQMEKRGTKVKCFRQGKEVILGCLISFYTRKMMCFLSGGKGI